MAIGKTSIAHGTLVTESGPVKAPKLRRLARFDSWAYTLAVGKALAALPVWLTEDLNVLLDLEASYEDACRALRIPSVNV
jgi:hypothetical protein